MSLSTADCSGRDGGIRTHDPLTPRDVRTMLRPRHFRTGPGQAVGRRWSGKADGGGHRKIVSPTSPRPMHFRRRPTSSISLDPYAGDASHVCELNVLADPYGNAFVAQGCEVKSWRRANDIYVAQL